MWETITPFFGAVPPVVLIDGDLHLRGQVRTALEDARELDDVAARALFDAAIMGVPLPAERLAAEFGPARIDEGEPAWRLARAGMLAGYEGRQQEAQLAVSILRDSVDPADADTLDTNRTYVEVIEAIGVLTRGNAEAALPALEDAVHSGVLDVHGTMWLLVEAYVRLGRLTDAERVLRTIAAPVPRAAFATYPIVRYRLGQVLEAQGREREAVEAYAYFAENWRTADPELQPLVRNALDAIARLSSDRARDPD
jgi:hypothetical protein